ncbi:MAG: hypothetical protein ABSE62_03520 [Chthoniobacteraceae bacterium]|jgi:hypothetical protein
MKAFKKFLSVSDSTGQVQTEGGLLSQISWEHLEQVGNLADYDGLLLNFSSLRGRFQQVTFNAQLISDLFDIASWTHVVRSGGNIVVIGDPANLRIRATDAGSRGLSVIQPVPGGVVALIPISRLLLVSIDQRSVDFRRVDLNHKNASPTAIAYLKGIKHLEYSIQQVNVAKSWRESLAAHGTDILSKITGLTTFETGLFAKIEFTTNSKIGSVTLLPARGKSSIEDETFCFSRYFGMELISSEPAWAAEMMAPTQPEIEEAIRAKRTHIETLAHALETDQYLIDQARR